LTIKKLINRKLRWKELTVMQSFSRRPTPSIIVLWAVGATLAALTPAIAADATWPVQTTDQKWQTNSNWNTNAFPGEVNNDASTNTDVATLAASSTSSAWGVDFSGGAGSGGHLALGAVVVNVTGQNILGSQFGTGTLTLNGATVAGVPNTAVSLAQGVSVVVSNTTSTSGPVLGLRLGNANSVINVSRDSRLAISSIVSERVAGSSILKTGMGQLSLTGANSFTGGITVADGGGPAVVTNVLGLSLPLAAIGLNSASNGLGTGPLTFQNTTDAGILYASNSSNVTIPTANTITLSSSPVTSQILVGVGTGSAGTPNRSLTINSKLTGGNAGAILQLNAASVNTANTLNVLKLTNPSNDFQGTLRLFRGTLAITSGAVLGNPANTLLFDQNAPGFGIASTTNTGPGGIRFDAANVVINQASLFQRQFSINVNCFNGADFAGNISNGNSGTGTINIWGGTVASGTASGSVRFSGTNSNSANYVVNPNTKLIVGSATALGDAVGTTTVANGATIAFDLNGVYANAESLSVSGAGVTDASAGVGAVQNLSGNNTFNGPINFGGDTNIGVVAGSLKLGGAASGGGSLTKTGAGALTISSSARQLFIGDDGSPTTTGINLQGGKLTFDYTSGSSPAAYVLSILDAGFDLSTPFSSGLIRSTTLAADRTLGWVDDGTSTVSIAATLAGDTNLDLTVDFADLLSLAQNYGETTGAVWRRGDFNYSGTVDFSDLLVLAQNYGQSGLRSFTADWALAQSMVPEPTTLATLMGLACGVLRRRR
jgi:fibronectin-binding autotransporter adhesin